MSSENNTDLNIESTGNIEETSIEGDKEYNFELDRDSVMDRLSTDIYQSEEAGVRELVANATTAVKKSVENNYITKEEGLVRVKIEKLQGMNKLIIQDNGIGMSREEIDKVVSVIGKSTNSKNGKSAGQFGMGLLSMFSLSGTDGIVTMSTKSRRTDEEIKGTWEQAMFKESDIPDVPVEYGTRFEVVVKKDISYHKLIKWCEDNLEWTRTNAMIEVVDEDGDTIKDDEWSYKTSFDDVYSSPIKFENNHIEVVIHEEKENNTVLLDVPIDTEPKFRHQFGSFYDGKSIRIKNENRVIVSGENKGMYVTQNPQNENEISFENTDSTDVWTPKPTGTREGLEQNQDFWNYVEDKITQCINDKIEQMRRMNNLEDIENNNLLLLAKEMNKDIQTYRTNKDINERMDELNSRFDVEEPLSSQIAVLDMSDIKRIKLDSDGQMDKLSKRVNKRITDIDEGSYIGVSINESKVKKVVEDYNSEVYKVPNTDWYDALLSYKNCELLKNVNSDKSFASSEITVHNEFGCTKKSIDEYIQMNDIVLFPEYMDKNINDYKSNLEYEVGCAKCSEELYKRVSDNDNVYTYDEYVEEISSEIKLITGDYINPVNLDDNDTVVSIRNNLLNHLRENDFVEDFRAYLKNCKTVSYGSGDYDGTVYITVENVSSIMGYYKNIRHTDIRKSGQEYYNFREYNCDNDKLLSIINKIDDIKFTSLGTVNVKKVDELFDMEVQ